MDNSGCSQEKDTLDSRNDNCAAGGNGGQHFMTASLASAHTGLQEEQKLPKRVVRYKECLKNHAAAMGGNATDGCGEFMPSGEEGTIEALKCSACNCHRNFHRQEIGGESFYDCSTPLHPPIFGCPAATRLVLTGNHQHNSIIGSSRPPPPPHHQMIVSYKSGSFPSEFDEKQDEHGGGLGVITGPVHNQKLKRRFRTKFTEEQKAKMLRFAEKAGWKMQKLDESVVQQFCQEVGIRRRVLKVWMHNNKNNFVKKELNPAS